MKTNNSYDVAVCGGGFAGISAALAAVREGKTVWFCTKNMFFKKSHRFMALRVKLDL